jgi:hypothetical protein
MQLKTYHWFRPENESVQMLLKLLAEELTLVISQFAQGYNG